MKENNFITTWYNDYRTGDLQNICLKEKGLLEESLEEAQCLLEKDNWKIGYIYRRTRVPFQKFLSKFIGTQEFMDYGFSVVSDTALRYMGQSINFSHLELDHSNTFVVHKDVVETLGLNSDRCKFYLKKGYRVKTNELVALDLHISKLCDKVRKLREWRNSPMYSICLKHFRYIFARLSELTEEFESYKQLNDITITLTEDYKFLVEVNGWGTELKREFPIARTRCELEKLIGELRAKHRSFIEKKKDAYELWSRKIITSLSGENIADGEVALTEYNCSNILCAIQHPEDMEEWTEQMKEWLKEPVQQTLISDVRHILNISQSLTSIRNCEEIGYCNYLFLRILDNNDIEVSLNLGKEYWLMDFSVGKTFSPAEDFETRFRVWWKQALLMQMKWLKSQLAELHEAA